MARAFVKGYKPGLTVNHKDEDKTNNIWLNLEWMTQEDNNKYYHLMRAKDKQA